MSKGGESSDRGSSPFRSGDTLNPAEQLLKLLSNALQNPAGRKLALHQFQQQVWNVPDPPLTGDAWEVLADLAHDLEFYEPDPKAREEDPSFYGDERLQEEIRTALARLKDLGITLPEFR